MQFLSESKQDKDYSVAAIDIHSERKRETGISLAWSLQIVIFHLVAIAT